MGGLVAVCVELPDGLFGMPGGGHFSVGVSGPQQANELLATGVFEPFLGLGEQAPDPIERVGLATTVPERLVLDTPAGFVELGVGVFDDMERIGHLGGPGHHGVEDGPIGTREDRGVAHSIPAQTRTVDRR